MHGTLHPVHRVPRSRIRVRLVLLDPCSVTPSAGVPGRLTMRLGALRPHRVEEDVLLSRSTTGGAGLTTGRHYPA